MPVLYHPKYFTLKELCKTNEKVKNTPECFQYVENLSKLASELDKIRDLINCPLIVNSAYRTSEVNKLVGGVANSYHLRGLAADVSCRCIPTIRLFELIVQSCFFSYRVNQKHYEDDDYEIIYYPERNFVHFAIKNPA